MKFIFYDSGLTHRVTLEILTKSASPSRNRTEQKYRISHGKKEKRSKKLKKIRKENIWNDYWINSISFVISVRLPSPSALCVYLHKMNFPSESSLSLSLFLLIIFCSPSPNGYNIHIIGWHRTAKTENCWNVQNMKKSNMTSPEAEAFVCVTNKILLLYLLFYLFLFSFCLLSAFLALSRESTMRPHCSVRASAKEPQPCQAAADSISSIWT